MSGFFITGTDTEVGKTLITAAILYQLQERGMNVCGFKPVVAGLTTRESHTYNEDLETLLLVSNHHRPTQNHLRAQDICPYHLPQPAAPHLVARERSICLELDHMVESLQILQAKFDQVVVEGAGGFLVPISEKQTLADFASEIRLPVIMVVDIRLGCINHALLTALAIRHYQLPLLGWVANSTSLPDVYYEENIESLSVMLKEQFKTELLGVIPFQNDLQTPYSLEIIQKVSKLIHL